MRFGTAVHSWVLEPDSFNDNYLVGPNVGRVSTTWRNAVRENPDKILLTSSEHRDLVGMKNSLIEHPKCCNALFHSKGENEQSFFAKDPQTGLELKCRADRYLENGYIVDLKTTLDASANAFAKSMASFNYHIQAAFYQHVIEQSTGERPRGFTFAAVEKEAPYACQFFLLSEDSMAEGHRQVRKLLNQLAELTHTCPDDSPWPSYNTETTVLELPRWAYAAS
jgi:exodeoxyribonuclease VIII